MPKIKCSVLDRNREKIFTRIATRGVVKFFNVCNQEQKEIETKVKVIAGNSERKKDKILSSIDKGSFLDRLKEDNDIEDSSIQDQNKPSWSVLRDDFIMGNKIKEWSDNDENDEDGEGSIGSEEKNEKPLKKFKNKKPNLKKNKK
ncbi:unnamed protein product [Brachionus calyciflorus]|uniref:RRP15-like protein n=1 Tax=Brachionus calyciflorus TaxID=104777 RepID=A0A813M638_9BILA|nr:unnamed protein product [Brachionus calyciflorus]